MNLHFIIKESADDDKEVRWDDHSLQNSPERAGNLIRCVIDKLVVKLFICKTFTSKKLFACGIITTLERVNSNLDLKCFIESSREKFHVLQCIPRSQQFSMLKPEMRCDECQEQNMIDKVLLKPFWLFLYYLWASFEGDVERPESKHRDGHKQLHETLSFALLHRIACFWLWFVKGGDWTRSKKEGSSRRLVREKRAPDNKESLSFSFREKWSPKGASKEAIKSKIC